MPAPIRFDGRVAVVTGGGGGLGRTYALMLAARGAKVVVNDLGGGLRGERRSRDSPSPADIVVETIRTNGGTAVANYDSVENGDKIIDTAIKNYGRIDILINNAGILRDSSFQKMTADDWDMVMRVHLKGAFACSKAAWKHMQQQNYGRIINTASGAGLYGNFGQCNYSAAKLALVGFTKSLAAEGEKRNVLVNCIAPLAGTRMTETILPSEVTKALKPEYVAPVVCYLAAESCKETGQVIELGAGWVSKVRWQRSAGRFFDTKDFTPEAVESQWTAINDFSNPMYPSSLQETLMMVTQRLSSSSASNSSSTNVSTSPSPSTPVPSLRAAKLFSLMQAFLQRTTEGPALVKKVGSIFHFDILSRKGSAPAASWTIDLRNGGGSVSQGRNDKADATFSMTDEDFASVCLGKLNPQIAFMQGKMKIKGNMRAATKFTPSLFPPITGELLELDVQEALQRYLGGEKDAAPNQPANKKDHHLKSAGLFQMMQTHLKSPSGAKLVHKVGCIYRFDILPKKGADPVVFTIDLKNPPGSVTEGTPPNSDAHFIMLDEDFVDVAAGKLNPQIAFMQGRMKIRGNMRAAMKFTSDLFPRPSSL